MIPAFGNAGILLNIGEKVAGPCRRTLENDEKWKQYSDENIFGFSSVTLWAFPAKIHKQMAKINWKMVGICQEMVEIHQIKRGDFRSESCFRSPLILGIFLQESVCTSRSEQVQFIIMYHQEIFVMINHNIYH